MEHSIGPALVALEQRLITDTSSDNARRVMDALIALRTGNESLDELRFIQRLMQTCNERAFVFSTIR